MKTTGQNERPVIVGGVQTNGAVRRCWYSGFQPARRAIGPGPRIAVPLAVLVIALTGIVHTDASPTGDRIPSEAFLQQVRDAFQVEFWGTLRGRIVHAGKDAFSGLQRAEVNVRLVFEESKVRAAVDVGPGNVYHVTQTLCGQGMPELVLDEPETVEPPGLAELGVQPSDLTLNFIYWKFVAELEPEAVGGQPCRVFKLTHPEKDEYVTVWLTAGEARFPLQVEWYDAGGREPRRMLRFKGSKRFGPDFWFAREMRLDGYGSERWKTKVIFEEGELQSTVEQPVPQGFLSDAD